MSTMYYRTKHGDYTLDDIEQIMDTTNIVHMQDAIHKLDRLSKRTRKQQRVRKIVAKFPRRKRD